MKELMFFIGLCMSDKKTQQSVLQSLLRLSETREERIVREFWEAFMKAREG